MSSNPRKPNILLMMADDHRAQSICALGAECLHTPTMDRLIGEGTCFMRNWHTGSYHVAVCVPTRAALHTGTCVYQASRQKDFRDAPQPDIYAMNPARKALGQALGEEGYHTFFVGKWHNDSASLNRSYGDGAGIYLGEMRRSDHYDLPISDYHADGNYRREDARVFDRHSTEIFTEEAVKFIDGYADEAPFFLTVAFHSPHDPHQAPEAFTRLYPPSRDLLPENFQQHPFDQGHDRVRDENLAAFPRQEDEICQTIAAYYAIIQHQDYHMGLILEALERRGELDNTIIVYTADHGLALGQHGLMGKQNLYEHSAAVPLVFRGPGVPGGVRYDRLTQTPDVYPTLCELAGVEVPSSVTASSLAPLMRDPSTVIHEYQFCLYFNLQRSVSDGRFKLIRYYQQEPDHTGLSTGTNTVQLFDLRNDPWEKHNLYGQEDYAGEAGRLAEALRRRMDEHDDMLKNVPVLI